MRKHDLTLIVLAAGMGSRFGGPKQIEAIGPSGEILLDYSVFDALRSGFERIVFVVRGEVESVLRERLTAALAERCDVRFVTQRLDDLPPPFSVPETRAKPWGTGQAVLACRDVVPGPFAVVNADDFYGADGFERVGRFLADSQDPKTERNALVGYPLQATLTKHGTVSRGICNVDTSAHLASIVERHGVGTRNGQVGYETDGDWHALPADAVASMNFWGLDPAVFPVLEKEFLKFLSADPGNKEEFRLPTAVGNMIDEGAVGVRVLQANATWLGVTHREDLVWVREGIRTLIAAGHYPTPLWPVGRARG
jgi:UTP-glucose-1-phosphate uridylyltransferase